MGTPPFLETMVQRRPAPPQWGWFPPAVACGGGVFGMLVMGGMYVMLCYVMLCYGMVWYGMLCYVMLCYVCVCVCMYITVPLPPCGVVGVWYCRGVGTRNMYVYIYMCVYVCICICICMYM